MNLKKVIQYFLADCNEDVITDEHITLSHRVVLFMKAISGGNKTKLLRAKEIAILGEVEQPDAQYVKLMVLMYRSCCIDNGKPMKAEGAYYGRLGDYVDERVKYLETIIGTGQYGVYNLTKFIKDDYTFTWFAPYDVADRWNLEPGDKVDLSFTVQKHEERYSRFETKITNVKLN